MANNYGKTILECAYLILVITKQSLSIPIDNSVDGVPEVACLGDSAKLAIQTAKPFNGHIYVKGQFRVPKCHLDFTKDYDQSMKELNFQASRPTVIYEVPYRDCNVKRERTIDPPGLSFTVPIVVQFHHLFTTKVDRAYTVTCFYVETTKSVTYGLDVSMLETTQLYQTRPMPVCTYDVLRGSLNGQPLRFAQVGEMAFHKWTCQDASGVYGILVHSCSATDGTGDEYKLIDQQGCAIDPVILNDLTYTPELTMAYVEVHVFKFADKMQFSIQCQISLCLLNDGACNGVTPPNCRYHHQNPYHPGPYYPTIPKPTSVPQPPAPLPASPPASSYKIYSIDSSKNAISDFSSSNPLPSYVIFPTPPPTGRYLSGIRNRHQRQTLFNKGIKLHAISDGNQHQKVHDGRFEETIDLATDDIFIFNVDDQVPIEGISDGQGNYRYNLSNTRARLNIDNGIDTQHSATLSQCVSVSSFILALSIVSLFLVSFSLAIIYCQRRYYLDKLISKPYSLRLNGFMS